MVMLPRITKEEHRLFDELDLIEKIEIKPGKYSKRLKYKNLKKYIEIQITKEIKIGDDYSYIQNGMHPCTFEDFEKLGVRDLDRDKH